MVHQKLIAILIILSISLSSKAEVLFEGYSKIVSGDQHIGYVISRYEFDGKKNQFQSTYFLKTGKGSGEITESLKAKADSELVPLSYEYTYLAGKESKTIDAKFKSGKMNAVIKSNGKVQKIDKVIPKGTFLSTFLVYLILKSKDGLKADTNYDYQAIAEEDASIEKGQALVGKEEPFNGLKAIKILNTFKNSKFISYVNDRGEVLGTNAIGQGIETKLVVNSTEATAGLPVSSILLKSIFGSVPEGKDNVVARASKMKEDAEKGPAETKQLGVPPGKGIVIKAQPEPEVKKGK